MTHRLIHTIAEWRVHFERVSILKVAVLGFGNFVGILFDPRVDIVENRTAASLASTAGSPERNSNSGMDTYSIDDEMAPMPKSRKYNESSMLMYSAEKYRNSRNKPNKTALPINGNIQASVELMVSV
jgi:hypothetical protein